MDKELLDYTASKVEEMLAAPSASADTKNAAQAWKDAIAFLVLILILIIRPTGILGERTADKL